MLFCPILKFATDIKRVWLYHNFEFALNKGHIVLQANKKKTCLHFFPNVVDVRFVYNWCILFFFNKLHHTWDNTKRFPFSKPAHVAFGLFLSVPIKIKGCTVTLNDVWGIKCQDHIRSHEKTFFRAYIYFYLALYCPYFTFTELLD